MPSSLAGAGAILYDKKINLNLCGNDVYYAECSSLVIFQKSCGKLYRQTGLNLIIFSCKNVPLWLTELDSLPDAEELAVKLKTVQGLLPVS